MSQLKTQNCFSVPPAKYNTLGQNITRLIETDFTEVLKLYNSNTKIVEAGSVKRDSKFSCRL